MRSHAFKIVAILMLVSMLFAPFSGQSVSADTTGTAAAAGKNALPVSDNGIYIVQLKGASLATYKGGIAGLKATSPEATGILRPDPRSPESKAYLDYLGAKQDELLDNMAKTFGRQVEVAYQYKNVLNAVAVRIDHAEALKAFALPGVKAVFADQARQMDTDIGPTLIGAPAIWDGDTYSGIATKGEGIIIGLIDSGINHAHPSFADIGGDGYDHENPYGAGNYLGYCIDNPDFCNDKLIGAYDFLGIGSPEDLDGHGSHTASTAGGNVVDVEIIDSTGTYTVTISGVAPHANLISYRVCYNNSCWPSASIAAVDQAIYDGTYVLNYSISGADDPWNDPVDLAFLEATAWGIFVSASAGNAGPDAGTVAKTGPWNAAVAATTHGRVYGADNIDVVTDTGSLMDIVAQQGTGPVLLADLTAPMLYGGDVDPLNPLAVIGCTDTTTGESPYPDGSFTGYIGLVQRGTCSFAEKVTNLTAAGAVGAVIFDHTDEPLIYMSGLELTTIPSMFIGLNDGLAVVALISGDATAEATMQPGAFTYDPAQADIMADFSSRGPSQWEVLKPDYAAPGVYVLAAVAALGDDPLQYAYYSGTSMAAPHGAGSAALMMSLHPDWSVAEIKSAIATTTNPDVLDTDGVTPADAFDMGSGRIDLAQASLAGLVMDETYENYLAANPDLGGQPKDLNQPSMVDYTCIGTCSWTRTIRSTTDDPQGWEVSVEEPAGMILSVSPYTFTLPAGGTQELVITAEITDGTANVGQYYFGEVILTPRKFEPVAAATPDAAILAVSRLPVVAQLQMSALPDLLDIVTDVTPGAETIYDLQALIEIEDLTVEVAGLAKGTNYEFPLNQDPTNGDAFDDLSQVFWTTVSVPLKTFRFIAEVVDTTAYDIDMWVGTGATPSSATVVCTSATSAWAEYCEIPDPAKGTYWVLIQNWAGSAVQPDAIKAVVGLVVDDDAGNMTITGPTFVPAQDFFDINVVWDEPSMVAGDYWYGRFTLGTAQNQAGNLGTVNVNLDFVGDYYGVGLEPATQDGFGDAGDTVPYTLTLTNLGNVADTFTLAYEANTWTVDLPVTSVDLEAGASADVAVNVTVPVDATGEDWDSVTVVATSTGDAMMTDSAVINTYVNQVFDITMTPATDAKQDAPGSVVDYLLTLTNLGNTVDTVTLAASGNLWDVNLSQASVDLAPGASVDVTVSVTIPADAVADASDVVTITATSEGDTASSMLTTTAVIAVYDIELTPATDAKQGAPGDVVAYTLTLTNLGNSVDVVTLAYADNVWDVSLMPTSVDLAPLESVDVVVNVTIPTDAIDGATDLVTITATSEGGEAVVSTLTTTVVVEPTFIYNFLPVVFKN